MKLARPFPIARTRSFAFALAAFAALTQPASAQSTWEKLEQGVDVIKECAGDVRKLCKDVKPGDGRIKACIAGNLAKMSTPCMKALAEPKPAVLSDLVNAKATRIENTHGMRFIEIFLAGIDPATGDIVAQCYGSYANPDIPANKDSAPQKLVESLDMAQIKKQYGVLGASLNGPKIWTPDWVEGDIGAVRQFGGMQMPSTAQLNLGRNVNIGDIKPYQPANIARKSAINWNKGTRVMLLDDAAGNTWIMKGFQLGPSTTRPGLA